MRNTIILTVLLFIAVVAASIYYFADINFSQKNPAQTLKYHPENTLFIAAFDNDETSTKLLAQYDIFDALLGKEEFLEISALKNNLLNAPNFSEYSKDVEILFSGHQLKDRIAYLYAIPLNKEIPAKELKATLSSLNKSYELQELDTLGNAYISFTHTLTKKSLYTLTFHNILYASYDIELLAQVQDKQVKKLSSATINEFVSQNSENSPLCLYVRHQELSTLAARFKQGQAGSYLGLLDSLQGHSILNLNFQDDAYIFSGESTTADSLNYISLFAKQTAIKQSLTSYFPENTASYISFALSNKKNFTQGLTAYINRSGGAQKVKSYQASFTKEKDQSIQSIFGNEFAQVELKNGASLGIVLLQDSLQAAKVLSEIGSPQGENIHRFNNSNLLYIHYGDLFQDFQRPYYIRIKNVLICANQYSVLKEYSESIDNKQLLTQQSAFQNMQQMQAAEANISFFLHPENAKTNIRQSLVSKFQKDYFDTEAYGYQDFNSWSLQLSGNKGKFLTKLCALYKSKKTIGGQASWTYELSSRLLNKPWVLQQAADRKMILVQEQNHTLHALESNGTKIWSSVFEGEILGEPVQLADYTILLNTSSRLYRIYPNGDSYAGFSIALPQRATAGLTLAKTATENSLLIPAGNSILAYNEQGTALNSWSDVQVEGNILGAVVSAAINNKLHVMVGTRAGNFYFFDQQGNLIQEINDANSYSQPLAFILDKQQPNKSAIITLSEEGSLVQFRLNGEKVIQPYTQIEEPKTFKAGQFMGKEQFFLASDKSVASFQGNAEKPLFSYTFPQTIRGKAQLFTTSNKQNCLAVATEGDLIYLFQENGSLQQGFPLSGLAHFYIGPLANANSANYIISSKRDHKLYCYPF